MLKKFLSKEGLITTRNFLNPCSKFIAITEDIYTFQEEHRIHEQIQKEDIEFFLSHPCKSTKEVKESWKKTNGEKILQPKIE